MPAAAYRDTYLKLNGAMVTFGLILVGWMLFARRYPGYAALLGLVVMLLVAISIPRLVGTAWTVILKFQPDAGWGVLVVTALMMGIAVWHLGSQLMRKRKSRTERRFLPGVGI